MTEKRAFVRKTSDVNPTPCPCGQSRRIITAEDGAPCSVHRVSLSGDAEVHYHNKLTECYVILEGSGEMILDDECVLVGPGDVVYIPPGTRHALRGTVEILNVVSPPFDASDEHLVHEERQTD